MDKKVKTKINRIFEQFGYAYFIAQGLEAELGILYSLAFAVAYKPGEHDIDKLMKVLNKTTLSQINQQLNKHLDFSADALTCIKSAIQARNYLAHQFFADCVPDIIVSGDDRVAFMKLDQLCVQLAAAKKMLAALKQNILDKRINLRDFVKPTSNK